MTKIIRVTGEGKASVRPDTIEISLSVSAIDKVYSKALEALDKKVLTIKEKMKKVGIEKITTSNFTICPRSNRVYDKHNNYKDEFIGFVANHSLSIKFNFDTEKLGEAIDGLTQSIAEPRFSINFSTEDLTQAKNEALGSAVQKAKSDCEILAKEAGVKLGDILSINHSFNEVRYSYPARYDMSPALYKEECLAKTSSIKEIEVDDINVTANVTIEWEIK